VGCGHWIDTFDLVSQTQRGKRASARFLKESGGRGTAEVKLAEWVRKGAAVLRKNGRKDAHGRGERHRIEPASLD